MESLDQFLLWEVREKERNVFGMSLRLSDHKILHTTVFSSKCSDFARTFSLFLLVFRASKLLEFITSYPTRAHGIIVK